MNFRGHTVGFPHELGPGEDNQSGAVALNPTTGLPTHTSFQPEAPSRLPVQNSFQPSSGFPAQNSFQPSTANANRANSIG